MRLGNEPRSQRWEDLELNHSEPIPYYWVYLSYMQVRRAPGETRGKRHPQIFTCVSLLWKTPEKVKLSNALYYFMNNIFIHPYMPTEKYTSPIKRSSLHFTRETWRQNDGRFNTYSLLWTLRWARLTRYLHPCLCLCPQLFMYLCVCVPICVHSHIRYRASQCPACLCLCVFRPHIPPHPYDHPHPPRTFLLSMKGGPVLTFL